MQKKKLLLLSAIVLLIGTNVHGKTYYPNGEIKQEDLQNSLKDKTIISVTNGKYGVITEEVKLDINNPGLDQTIMNINSGDGNTNWNKNQGTLSMINNSNNKLNVVKVESGKFDNGGAINVDGKNVNGINIRGTKESETINSGTINVKNGATGIYTENYVKDKGSKITNTGKIIVTNKESIGINISQKSNSIVENKGIIDVTDKATGVAINNTNGASFTNTGAIVVKGEDTRGITIEGGNENSKIINEGLISVENGGIGVEINDGSFENSQIGIIKVNGKNGKGIVVNGGATTNNGVINVTGDSSKGIYLKGAGTVATNNGVVVVGKDLESGVIDGKAEGITLDNGEFTNTKDGTIQVYGSNSKGIRVNKGTATNEGTIDVYNGATGAYVKGGDSNFTNTGTMNALEKGAKAIQIDVGGTATNEGNINVANGGIGVHFYGNGKFTNAEGSTIEIFGNDSKGIQLAKNGTAINEGTIKGNGIGVNLEGGTFTNSGTIDISGGNAIVSSKGTNNTVYLKNGSKINGAIKGDAGIDILALEGNKLEGNTGEYSDLNVSNYEALVVRDGDVTINNSQISLDYNKGTKDYLDEAKNKLDTETGEATSGNLTMNDSKLVVNFGDSLKTGEALENPIIDVGDNGTLTFDGNTSFIFNSKDRDEYNVNEILGVDNIEFGDELVLDSTIIWDYYEDENGNLIAKKDKYGNIVTNSYISDFANALDKARPSFGDPTSGDPNNKFFENVIVELESLKNADDFTRGLTQLSGGIHGYTVDIAAINSRTLVNAMKNKALTRDYLTVRPINSWYQDVVYLNNNQRLGGLMSGSYQENGVLGISEKQSFSNGRLGFVYGGSKGKAKFDGGESGEISTDNIYVGLYYNHDLSEKLALNTNFSFVYGHNSVNRRVRIGNLDETLKSHYPTYAMGIGTSAIYTVKDDAKNKASFYAGIDVNRIMQGNINEKEEIEMNKKDEINLMVKNGPVSEQAYYSITPSAGFMVQNTGYIFDKKYLIGADLAWETELGNIKDGKKMNMKGIVDQYKVGTMERENIFSTSIFGQLDMTESLALNGRYTSSTSDEYDADMVTLGMTYKMDTMLDVPVLGPLVSGIENSRSLLSSDRWGGTFALMMEAEDDSDRVYYKGNILTSGDYATSMQMKPKFTLSLNDKKTNWAYYFEGYYKANDFLKDTKAGEAEQKATRLHGEARWSDSYSKGNYGVNIGYRHETANKPTLTTYPGATRVERGVHQLRITPNFSYNLGSGFIFGGKTTAIFEYNYTGLREGQMDFLQESEYGITYTGFMPRWNLRTNIYRADTWFDHDNVKLGWDTKKQEYIYSRGAGKYQSMQLRPSATYYFGNGDSVTFALRIPLGNGAWYNELGTNIKSSESYERRYSIDYNHIVTPGFSVFGGITFVDIKTKITKPDDRKISSAYSFRPKLGFSYSF